MDIIERKIAAGLRALSAKKRKPIALIFTGVGILEWTWDMPDVFGIPVYHTDIPIDAYGESLQECCPFIPVFSDDTSCEPWVSKKFAEAYDEYAEYEE